jgi:hypothetical protein
MEGKAQKNKNDQQWLFYFLNDINVQYSRNNWKKSAYWKEITQSSQERGHVTSRNLRSETVFCENTQARAISTTHFINNHDASS